MFSAITTRSWRAFPEWRLFLLHPPKRQVYPLADMLRGFPNAVLPELLHGSSHDYQGSMAHRERPRLFRFVALDPNVRVAPKEREPITLPTPGSSSACILILSAPDR